MTDLAPHQTLEVAEEIVSEPARLIEVIARAAGDPNIDVAKLTALADLHERLALREALVLYMTALAAMQPELPDVAERGGITNNSGQVQSTYARWEDINAAIKPVLHRHGFGLSFRTGHKDGGGIMVTGILSHRAGHAEETTIVLPADTTGNKNAVQAVASSVSYGKRYTAGALLNLTSRGEDDDGQAAGGPDPARELEGRYIADINMLDTAAEFENWRAKNAESVKRDLSPAGSSRVVDHYRRRWRIRSETWPKETQDVVGDRAEIEPEIDPETGEIS